MFIGDILLIGFLAQHAYRDGNSPLKHPIERQKWLTRMIVDSLEHYEVPFFGRFANSFVDDE